MIFNCFKIISGPDQYINKDIKQRLHHYNDSNTKYSYNSDSDSDLDDDYLNTVPLPPVEQLKKNHNPEDIQNIEFWLNKYKNNNNDAETTPVIKRTVSSPENTTALKNKNSSNLYQSKKNNNDVKTIPIITRSVTLSGHNADKLSSAAKAFNLKKFNVLENLIRKLKLNDCFNIEIQHLENNDKVAMFCLSKSEWKKIYSSDDNLNISFKDDEKNTAKEKRSMLHNKMLDYIEYLKDPDKNRVNIDMLLTGEEHAVLCRALREEKEDTPSFRPLYNKLADKKSIKEIRMNICYIYDFDKPATIQSENGSNFYTGKHLKKLSGKCNSHKVNDDYSEDEDNVPNDDANISSDEINYIKKTLYKAASFTHLCFTKHQLPAPDFCEDKDNELDTSIKLFLDIKSDKILNLNSLKKIKELLHKNKISKLVELIELILKKASPEQAKGLVSIYESFNFLTLFLVCLAKGFKIHNYKDGLTTHASSQEQKSSANHRYIKKPENNEPSLEDLKKLLKKLPEYFDNKDQNPTAILNTRNIFLQFTGRLEDSLDIIDSNESEENKKSIRNELIINTLQVFEHLHKILFEKINGGTISYRTFALSSDDQETFNGLPCKYNVFKSAVSDMKKLFS